MFARTACAVFFALTPACLYDKEGTQGLPCNVDEDCAAQACVDGICGGGTSTDDTDGEVEDDDGGESSGVFDDMPTPQSPPEPCSPATQTCVGSNDLAVCSDDRKLRTFQCEAFCGPDDPVTTCAESPLDGVEYCWCASVGRPSFTCGASCSFDTDCSPGESCFQLTTGFQCAPTSCQGCFDAGQSCGWYEATCKFTGCG